MKNFIAACALLLWPVHHAVAQGEAETGSKESKNYEKAGELLPGEEVVTPTGQRLKVWSTKGPVPVQRAPEPFDDPSDSSTIDGVIVDVDSPLIRDERSTDEE